MKNTLFITLFFLLALPAFGQETGVYLTDANGNKISQFNVGDSVYLEGICPSAGGTAARIYIAFDKTWKAGDELRDVSAGIEIMQVPSNGTVARTKIWNYAIEGAYDMLIDTNNDLILQDYESCIIGKTDMGFRVGSPPPPPPVVTPTPTPVAPIPTPTPPSPPMPAPTPIIISSPSSQPSQIFSLGAYVEVKNLANVRQAPGGSQIGQQTKGALGTIAGGPVQASIAGIKYWFWNVDFIDAPDGWVAENTIQAASKPKPEPEPTPEVVEKSEPEPEIKVAEAPVEDKKPAEKELAQISETTQGLGLNSFLGSLIIGVAILFGLVIGSSIIARAIRKN